MIAYIVLGLAAVALSAILWARNRRTNRTDITLAEHPDRGIIGEATTAFEDIGRQFLQEDVHQRPAKKTRKGDLRD